MSEIKCPQCGVLIEIDKVLEDQVERKVIAEMEDKHSKEMQQLRAQVEGEEKEKLKKALEEEAEKIRKSKEIDFEELRKKLEAEQKSNKELLEKMSKLLDELSTEKKAKEAAEFEAKKKMIEESEKIAAETRKKIGEEWEYKYKEMEKQLNDTKDALETAKKKAEQGSQQTQGEVLELELEECLRGEFIFDEIVEVKKGQRGADIKQIVKEMTNECGMILWETKNASWQQSWIQKFKEDIREANATIGILVSANMPDKHDDIVEIDGIWVTKPRYALAVGELIRAQIVGINRANRYVQNKDAKMELLYTYLVGPEFKHRVGAIIDNYKMLRDELDKEKRSAERRWSKQEKAIEAVIKNTSGMYGDLQGLVGSALEDIKQLEAGDDEE